MIKITRDRLLASQPGIKLLSNMKAPIAISFRVNKLIKEIGVALKETEEIRQQILEKYGTKDESGKLVVNAEGYVEISDANREAFNNEFAILLQEECELSGDPIPVSLLPDLQLTPAELSLIEPFLSF